LRIIKRVGEGNGGVGDEGRASGTGEGLIGGSNLEIEAGVVGI